MADSAKTELTGELSVRALTEDTWPAFARLAEANNGIWGGCWCMGFHVNLSALRKSRLPGR